MWKLKIAEGSGPYLYSTNNFVGRQIWEYDPNGGTDEERQSFQKARDEYIDRKNNGYPASGDVLMRIQLIRESGIDLLSTPPVRVGVVEHITHETVTTVVKKAIHLHRAIQASDGHWPAENSGPLFFTPPLIIALYISGAMNTVLTAEHKKEMIRYIYNHQNKDGGWGFYVEGHSTMIGSAPNYIALRLLGEGVDENCAITNGRKWILDHGGATGIPSWGKIYLSMNRDPAPLHKTAKLLINGQMDNGDFPQQEITAVVMKNCKLHYPQYRNIFTSWALAEYRKHVWPSKD